MHEFSIAAGLVEKLLHFAEANREKKIVEVRLALGELTHVAERQLRFCYQSITTETPFADSILEIEKISAQVRCAHCGYAGAPKYWEDILPGVPIPTLQCPQCGKAAEATAGHECAIRTLRYQLVA
jgi:hydrogenase nickel insertion protein HypA